MTQPFTEYSDREHKYFVDGREYPSVTKILDLAGLISPFARDEEARQRGSDVHAFCALDDTTMFLSKTPTQLDLRKVRPDLRGYIKAWRKYRLDSGFIPELIEYRVDDHSNRYAGRLDREGRRPGSPYRTIIDLKTSKTGAVAGYVRLQLAAYCNALKAGHVFERIAVSLKPDGTYKCHPFPPENFHQDLAEFFQILKRVQVQL